MCLHTSETPPPHDPFRKPARTISNYFEGLSSKTGHVIGGPKKVKEKRPLRMANILGMPITSYLSS